MPGINQFNISDVSKEEQDVLDEVFLGAGLRYRRIGGIDTRLADIAAKVLPILKRHLVRNDRLRGEILLRFATPHAKKFFNELFEQWIIEDDHINRDILTRAIIAILTNSNATRVWHALRVRAHLGTSEIELISYLSRYPSVAKEVVEHILWLLDNKTLNKSEFAYVRRIKNPTVENKVREIESRRKTRETSETGNSRASGSIAAVESTTEIHSVNTDLPRSIRRSRADAALSSLETKLDFLARCGLSLAPHFTAQDLLGSYSREAFEKPGFDLTLVALGMTEERPPWRSYCVNAWHFDFECIEDGDSYKAIAERLSQLTQGSLPLKNITSRVNRDEETVTLHFESNGIPFQAILKMTDDWVDPALFSKFSQLLARFDNSKIFISNQTREQSCVIACVTRDQYAALKEARINFVQIM